MNKVKLITLWGRGNCGKTQTLNLVISKLMQLQGSKVLYEATPNYNNDNANDHCIVLAYKTKNIAVITNGDDEKILKKQFANLPFECDLYICASRTKGSSCKWLLDFAKGSNILWHRKWTVSLENVDSMKITDLQNEANELQAEGIVRILKKLL